MTTPTTPTMGGVHPRQAPQASPAVDHLSAPAARPTVSTPSSTSNITTELHWRNLSSTCSPPNIASTLGVHPVQLSTPRSVTDTEPHYELGIEERP
eukprot:1653814-Pyramimonas_sp.AAC.1